MKPSEELPLSRELPVPEDVGRELAHHLAEREAELRALGWNEADAREEARRVFGALGPVEAECRTITRRTRRARHRAERHDALRQDLVLAVRLLRKSWSFSLTAVLTLALGIGASAALFSVVNELLLRPLPYERPGELMDLVQTSERGWSSIPWANMVDLRSRSRSFSAMASYGSGSGTALTNHGPVIARTAAVSLDFFALFGVGAAEGRLPVADEHRVGAPPVAVVSHHFWQTRLGGTANLAAERIRLGRDYQVIGVLPDGFAYPRGVEIWFPLEQYEQPTSRTAHNWSVVGRLRGGVRAEDADRELDTLTAQLARTHLPDFDAVGAEVRPLQEVLTATARRPLYLLLGASALLLLAACTNIASTILARGMGRRHEFAVRMALGAGRLRVVRQLFTESVVIGVLGTAAGLVLAHGILRLFLAAAPAALRTESVRLDGWVLLFTALTGLVVTVLIGLFPALRVSGAAPGAAIRGGTRGGRSREEGRIWQALVVIEVMLAVMLLCTSGLLIRSFAKVGEVDPGFRPAGVLTAALELPTVVYDDDRKIDAVWTRVLAAVRALPGVRSAGVTTSLPLGGSNASGSFGIEGVPPAPSGYGPGQGAYRAVTEGYLSTMGIPLLAGRDFDARDVDGAAGVIIVNQRLVETFFKDRDPVGHRIQLQSGMDGQGEGWLTIVGVVGDVRHNGLTRDAYPETYVPLHQRPTRGRDGVLVIEAAEGNPDALRASVEATLRAVVPDAVPTMRSMDDLIDSSQGDRRFTMSVLTVLAGLALLLAGLGIYGVVSYTVAQRTREMGLRLALGATPPAIRSLVQSGAMRQVAIGLALGLGLTWLATGAIRTLLFGVQQTDPAALVGAVGLLAAVGWFASWLPARRIARLDPMRTIRAE